MPAPELFLDHPLDLTIRHQDPPSSPLDSVGEALNISPASSTADEEERSDYASLDNSFIHLPVVLMIQQHPSTDDEDSVHPELSTKILSGDGSVESNADALDDPEGKIINGQDISSASEIPCIPNPSGRGRKLKIVTSTRHDNVADVICLPTSSGRGRKRKHDAVTSTPASTSKRVQTTTNNRRKYTRVTDNMAKTNSSSGVTTHSFKCDVCYKECFDKTRFNRHLKVHTGEKPFECQHCEKFFAERSQLESHERTHTGEKLFICQYCPKAFAQFGTRKDHERTHTGEKPYHCNICWKQFGQRSSLYVHKRVHHTGEKPFKCQYCDKTFSQIINKKNHERSHNGEKPFHCVICWKTFMRDSYLKDHINSVHLKVCTFKCGDCGKSFSTKYTLRTHMGVHTGENLRKRKDLRRGI